MKTISIFYIVPPYVYLKVRKYTGSDPSAPHTWENPYSTGCIWAATSERCHSEILNAVSLLCAEHVSNNKEYK